MKKNRLIPVLGAVLAMTAYSPDAQAGPKPWPFSWWESHWEGLDFIPYQNGKHPHNSQWESSKWQPRHWTAQRGGDAMEVVRGFYAADIVRRQYVDDDIPVLEVGPAFYMLGGQDQRRVAEMVDHVYNITGSKENGMFQLFDWKTGEPIGAYTRYGLQLQ